MTELPACRAPALARRARRSDETWRREKPRYTHSRWSEFHRDIGRRWKPLKVNVIERGSVLGELHQR